MCCLNCMLFTCLPHTLHKSVLLFAGLLLPPPPLLVIIRSMFLLFISCFMLRCFLKAADNKYCFPHGGQVYCFSSASELFTSTSEPFFAAWDMSDVPLFMEALFCSAISEHTSLFQLPCIPSWLVSLKARQVSHCFWFLQLKAFRWPHHAENVEVQQEGPAYTKKIKCKKGKWG